MLSVNDPQGKGCFKCISGRKLPSDNKNLFTVSIVLYL